MAEQLPLPSRAHFMGVLSMCRCNTSECSHCTELLLQHVRGEPPLGHTTGRRSAWGHGWPCSGYPWLAPACCFPMDCGAAAWGLVTKAGDPSLEHFIFPEVLTLSLTKFSADESKGEPHCSVFSWVAPKLPVKTSLGPAPRPGPRLCDVPLAAAQHQGFWRCVACGQGTKQSVSLFPFSLIAPACLCRLPVSAVFGKACGFGFHAPTTPVPSVWGFHVYPGRVCALLHLPRLNSLCFSLLFCFLPPQPPHGLQA